MSAVPKKEYGQVCLESIRTEDCCKVNTDGKLAIVFTENHRSGVVGCNVLDSNWESQEPK